MANYSLVINSKFQPFSFERYLQPYQIYGQAYREQEDAYADLATKAATVESMANEQTDPESYEAYQNYANALKAQADVLAREGLTPSSRKAMLDLRKRYTQEVVPIQDAYNRRKEQAKLQAEIRAKDSTHMFARMAATTSLDDYRNNKNLDLTLQSYSGAMLAKQVSDAAAALAKDARNDPNVQTELRKLLPYQYEVIRRTGFAPEAVRQAILNSPNADKILTGLVDTAIANSGVNDWNYASPEDRARIIAQARYYANLGLWSAVGQTQYGSATDQAGLTRLQYDLQDRNSQRAESRAAVRALQKQQQELAQGIALSGQSYLVASGKDKEYLQTLQGLKVGDNGVKASIFGKDGKANALTVYDEYRKAGKATLTPAQVKEADKRAEAIAMQKWEKMWGKPEDRKNIPPQQRGIAAQQLDMMTAAQKAAEYTRVAQEAVLKKHGVTQVLTKDQYNTLKAIGYNGEQMLSMDQFNTAVNNLSTERAYYSTNMSGYSIPDAKIRSALGNWELNKSFSGRVYKLNADGTRGKAMSYSDLKLKSDNNPKGRQVTGIYYSDVTPTKIIIQLGDGTGDRYLVDPNALGSEVQNFITNARAELQDVSSTERAQTITIGLANLLNSYNPTLSTTSSQY
jgi:hypothetical protein